MQDKKINLDELETVSGGGKWTEPADNWKTVTDEPGKAITCPNCGSVNLSISKFYSAKHADFTCNNCGKAFTVQIP